MMWALHASYLHNIYSNHKSVVEIIGFDFAQPLFIDG